MLPGTRLTHSNSLSASCLCDLIGLHEPVFVRCRVVNDHREAVQAALFTLTAVKLNQCNPHVLASDALSEKWGFRVYNEVWRFVEILVQSPTDVFLSRCPILNECRFTLLTGG